MEKQIAEALRKVQKEIKVPKNQFNSFGKYSYRNAEDILAAATPLLVANNLTLTIADEVVEVGGRIYVKSVALINGEPVGSAFAREPESKKGMDDAQITGATSSYARKYLLNGVFLLDDVKDADSMDNRNEGKVPF
jgi:hypothetical protein